jgi:hypothetical protein
MFGIDDLALGAIGAGGALGGGLFNYLGAQSAAKAANKAAALQQQRFEETKSLATPYISGGQDAYSLYNTAIGANGTDAQKSYYSNFQNDPGFQSEVNYGLSQAEARAAAQGQNVSGNTLQALSDYSQKNLSSEYQARLNQLYNSSTLGSNALNSLSGAATTSANNQGNYLTQAGQYNGAGLSQLGSAATKALTSGTNTLADYYYGS